MRSTLCVAPSGWRLQTSCRTGCERLHDHTNSGSVQDMSNICSVQRCSCSQRVSLHATIAGVRHMHGIGKYSFWGPTSTWHWHAQRGDIRLSHLLNCDEPKLVCSTCPPLHQEQGCVSGNACSLGGTRNCGAPLPYVEAAQPCLTFACMTLEMACLMTSSLLLFCATTKQTWDVSQVISNWSYTRAAGTHACDCCAYQKLTSV